MTWKDELNAAVFWFIVSFAIVLTLGSLARGQTKSQAAMLATINAARAEQTAIDGVERKPLTWSADLAKAASTYARTCSKDGWQHNLYPTTYVREHSEYFTGYDGQVGELLAHPLRVDPAWAWLHSDAHRAILLLPWWQDIGIGTAGGKTSGAVCFVGIRWPKDARAAAQQQCVGGT